MKHEHNEWNVYCYTNLITGQQYVGCTYKKLYLRSGKNGASYTRRPNPFGDAIKQYGWDNFVSEIIEVVSTQDEAFEREKYYIEHLHSLFPDGYNRSHGGAGCTGYGHPSKNYWIGKTYPEEAKKIISQKLKGRTFSEETKMKHSEASMGRVWSNDGIRNYFGYEIKEGHLPGMLKRSTR